MRNVYAKFERQKIGRSKSKLDAIHRQHTVHMAYDLHGSKSHKHASRRSNILKNFHSYICTELLVEGYSVQRNNAASISAACDMPSVCTKQATPFSWVSCKRTKARALESLPSIKKYMRSDLKTSPEWWLSVESAGRFTSFLASFSANRRLLHPITSRQVYKTMEQEYNYRAEF